MPSLRFFDYPHTYFELNGTEEVLIYDGDTYTLTLESLFDSMITVDFMESVASSGIKVEDFKSIDVSSVQNGYGLVYNNGTWGTSPTGATYLNNISDCDFILPLQDGDVLTYYYGEWINQQGSVASINDFSDVTLSGILYEYSLLKYNTSSSQWENIPATISSLSDTTISSNQNGQVLLYDTGNWVNSTVNFGTYVDVVITTPVNNHVLRYDDTLQIWKNVLDSPPQTILYGATDPPDPAGYGENSLYIKYL